MILLCSKFVCKLFQDQEKNIKMLEDLRQQNETWRINEQNKMKVYTV